MLDNLFGSLLDLWNNIYNARSWERAFLIITIFSTVIASAIFTFRMARYKDKDFLDWTILLREVGWFLLGFRYATAVGLDWDWGDNSWWLWAFMSITTILALVASQREHFLSRYSIKSPRWRQRSSKG